MDAAPSGDLGSAPVAVAWAWLDAAPGGGTEIIQAARTLGRVVAAAIASPCDLPDRDCAARDGFAVPAAATEGACAYSPIVLAATPIAAGHMLPVGTDAVLPFESFDAPEAAALANVAPGEGVIRQGEQLRAGDPILPAGLKLRPDHVALLAALRIESVAVRRAPRVELRIAGPKAGPDTLRPLLSGLLAGDGAVLTDGTGAGEQPDLFLFAGRSGPGPDDDAAALLGRLGGRLELHGIALRPGGTAGLGWLGGMPALLLPGEPLACLAAYTVLAGRLVRRLAGLPWPAGGRRAAILRRKLVSAIGVTDFARVRLDGAEALPLGEPDVGGLPGAARADGFVLVPETSEGLPPGSPVTVHTFDPEAAT